jgi:hypothetical protein
VATDKSFAVWVIENFHGEKDWYTGSRKKDVVAQCSHSMIVFSANWMTVGPKRATV